MTKTLGLVHHLETIFIVISTVLLNLCVRPRRSLTGMSHCRILQTQAWEETRRRRSQTKWLHLRVNSSLSHCLLMWNDELTCR